MSASRSRASRWRWERRDARCGVLIMPGRAVLSAARRAGVLARVREVSPHITTVQARWIHLVVGERELTGPELAQLGQMLDYGPREEASAPTRRLETVETVSFVVTPRIGTVSPWSSKATDIAHVCGLTAITR